MEIPHCDEAICDTSTMEKENASQEGILGGRGSNLKVGLISGL